MTLPWYNYTTPTCGGCRKHTQECVIISWAAPSGFYQHIPSCICDNPLVDVVSGRWCSAVNNTTALPQIALQNVYLHVMIFPSERRTCVPPAPRLNPQVQLDDFRLALTERCRSVVGRCLRTIRTHGELKRERWENVSESAERLKRETRNSLVVGWPAWHHSGVVKPDVENVLLCTEAR